MTQSPRFGEADLTNCERELIHLPASVQPRGVLLTLHGPRLEIVQASANCASLLGRRAETLLGLALEQLGGDAEDVARSALKSAAMPGPEAIRCLIPVAGRNLAFEGALHQVEGRWWVLELEPVDPELSVVPTLALEPARLEAELERAIVQVSAASTIQSLADAAVRGFRAITGYDRLMVYKFDPDGHGMIIAEDRDPSLESLLDHRYPASDIPQRARQLYLRNRIRLLANVDYEPARLVPATLDGAQSGELDMSMCYLRSMSPLHLQYLKNMGVSATLVVSLVRNGRLWGLVAAHHYAPRNLDLALRTACDMLGEVVSTRLAAVEAYAHAHVALQVHRLEQRLVEATSTDGDWRVALFRNSWNLLGPVEATGAALFFGGEVMTAGDVPSTPQLHALLEWLERSDVRELFETASIARANPELAELTPTASGVLAVRLSSRASDFLVWLRKEQLHSATWAGNPDKPVIADDPLTLSPRRSFAAWTELVRDTAQPWSSAEIALARAFGHSLVGIIARVNAVRYLIAQHQLQEIGETVRSAKRAMVLVGPDERLLMASGAFRELFGELEALPPVLLEALRAVRKQHYGVRRKIEMSTRGGRTAPIEVRAECVQSRRGEAIGYFLMFEDLTETQQTDDARRSLELTIGRTGPRLHEDPVVSAVHANASLAALDIADGHPTLGSAGAEVLHEVEASTTRATDLYRRVLRLTRRE